MSSQNARAVWIPRHVDRPAVVVGEGFVQGNEGSTSVALTLGVDPASRTVMAVRLLGPPEVRRWETTLRRLARGLDVSQATGRVLHALRSDPTTFPRSHAPRLVRRAWREALRDLEIALDAPPAPPQSGRASRDPARAASATISAPSRRDIPLHR